MDLALPTASTITPPSLKGPEVLSLNTIDRTIRSKVAGIYVLSAKVGSDISPRRLGRADDDLGSAVKSFIGLYSHFSWAFASTPKNAFGMECALYHAGTPPESPSHPARTTGTDWACPVCGR